MSDLKEALKQRIARQESLRNSIGGIGTTLDTGARRVSFDLPKPKPQAPSVTGSSISRSAPPQKISPISTASTATPRPEAPSVRCEGYLYKFSSGTFTSRWQRRYFILDSGRLGYYRDPPANASTPPKKTFGLRKVRRVYTVDPCPPGERVFSKELGDNTYQ